MFSTAILAAGLLATSVLAAPEAGTVGFQFTKRYGQQFHEAVERRDLERRQSGYLYSLLSNELVFYQINVTVGTPGQRIGLQVDTGSSDIWFPDAGGSLCRTASGGCPLGSYDHTKSSTFGQLNYPPFAIGYVDGTQIQGAYFTDVLTISGTSIKNVTMAAASSGGRGFGIMGIAFRAGESSAQNSGRTNFEYPNILDSLQSSGLIKDISYSLWLDDLQSNTGSILFGGVDTSKYHGQLISLPIQQDAMSGDYTSMTVAWTGLTLHNSGPVENVNFSPSSPQPAILDSGTTLTYVPDNIAQQLFNAFGVTTVASVGNLLPCRLGANNVTLAFQFGGANGPSINVPLSEFLIGPLQSRKGGAATFSNGDTICKFGIDSAGDNPILFGDTFLRSAYVVYDLQNLQIAIAQTNFQSSNNINSASVQVIQTTGIPDVASTASAVSLVQTASESLFTGDATDTAVQSFDSTGTGDIYRTATLSFTATGTVPFTAQGQAATGSGGSSASRSGSTGGGASGSANGAESVHAVQVHMGIVGAIVASAFAFGAGMIML